MPAIDADVLTVDCVQLCIHCYMHFFGVYIVYFILLSIFICKKKVTAPLLWHLTTTRKKYTIDPYDITLLLLRAFGGAALRIEAIDPILILYLYNCSQPRPVCRFRIEIT